MTMTLVEKVSTRSFLNERSLRHFCLREASEMTTSDINKVIDSIVDELRYDLVPVEFVHYAKAIASELAKIVLARG